MRGNLCFAESVERIYKRDINPAVTVEGNRQNRSLSLAVREYLNSIVWRQVKNRVKISEKTIIIYCFMTGRKGDVL